MIDADGHAWYSDFGNQMVGELDPKTGKVTDYALPPTAPDQPKGSLDLELDPDGNLWVGMSYQGGAAKIDRKTKRGHALSVAAGMAGQQHADQHGDADAYECRRQGLDEGHGEPRPLSGWISRAGNGRTSAGQPTPRAAISAATACRATRSNNVYMLEFGNTRIGRLDAKTNVAKIWSTPMVRSRPRRGRFDDQGKLWFGEYRRQQHRDVRSRHRADQGMEAADAVERAL